MRVKINNKWKHICSVWFENKKLKLIDQRKLPNKLVIYSTTDYKDVYFAIKNMIVRGAPAIGVTAAYGIALAYLYNKNLDNAFEVIATARPTANDLFYALEYMQNNRDKNLVEVAKNYANEIVEKCKKIGIIGEKLIPNNAKILTHCNAGALASVDYGTALAPLRFAHYNRKKILVYCDETRPRLQGFLTAWELKNEGINYKIIADNASGYYMQKGIIDMVIVGADRIARNGDVANKIGTYEKAVVAKEIGIPFYVSAPITTFDFSLRNGNEIKIEYRDCDEILGICKSKNFNAENPAFDITASKYITGYITELGVVKNVNEIYQRLSDLHIQKKKKL